MIPDSFFRVHWDAPPNSVSPQGEPFARAFDNRREALEFAHRKGMKHGIDVTVLKYRFAGETFETMSAKCVGLKRYHAGHAGEALGDFT